MISNHLLLESSFLSPNHLLASLFLMATSALIFFTSISLDTFISHICRSPFFQAHFLKLFNSFSPFFKLARHSFSPFSKLARHSSSPLFQTRSPFFLAPFQTRSLPNSLAFLKLNPADIFDLCSQDSDTFARLQSYLNPRNILKYSIF